MDSSTEYSNVELLDAPDKSPYDKNQYRIIRLPNGIKTLLISAYDGTVSSSETTNASTEAQASAETESANEYLSGASLVVDVGSFSNPPDVQGLAHLLEHLVFMGSEKYPEAIELTDFITNAGGDYNASTAGDITHYYMGVRGKYFSEALDRFAQMFVAPLIAKSSVLRERLVVDAESSMRASDEERAYQVMLSLGTENHPSRQFECGNSKSLIDNVDEDTLIQKLCDFRQRHYSAHRMYLGLKAALPLDSLQELAVRHFGNIPSNNLPGIDFSEKTHLNAFPPKCYEKVYFVKSIKNVKCIQMTWCIESQVKFYRTKPIEYLLKILLDKAEGGLTNFLLKKGWCTEVSAGCTEQDVLNYFYIYTHLTDDGFRRLDDVVEALFAYFRFLKQTGPSERLFREYQTIAANNFLFADDQHIVPYWKSGPSLRYYSPKDALKGDSIFFEYDPAAIQRAIDVLNTRTFIFNVVSPEKYDENIQFESKEKWLGAEYSERDMPEKWVSMWENVQPFKEFTLPAPNPFIADDFTIFYDKNHPVPKYPTKILENDVCELWFRQDDKFLLPHACCYFYFTTPLAMSSTKNTCLLHLYEKLLLLQIERKLALAALADINFEVETRLKGLQIQVNGFNQKLDLIVDRITKEMRLLIDEVDEHKMQTVIDAYINELDTEEGYDVVDGLITTIVYANHLSNFAMKEQLRQIRLEDLRTFCRDLWKQMRVIAIIQGNMTEETAQTIMQTTLANIDCGKIEDPNSVHMRSLQIPTGAHYIRIKFADSENCYISNYYEIGPRTLRSGALLGLLRTVTSNLAANILRTEEQLGYIASFSTPDRYGVLAYTIRVESKAANFTTEYVDERIEAFRSKLLSIIETLPDAEFEQYKDVLRSALLIKDKSLNQETKRNWSELVSGQLKFNRKCREAEIVSTVRKEELVQFYRDHYGANDRKLSVQLISAELTNDDELVFVDFEKPHAGTLIRDIDDFKSKLEVQPPPE